MYPSSGSAHCTYRPAACLRKPQSQCFRGRKGRDFPEILGERVGCGGTHFMGQGERKNGVKRYKIMCFDPLIKLIGLVGQKKTKKLFKRPSLSLIDLFYFVLYIKCFSTKPHTRNDCTCLLYIYISSQSCA
jgi:hypothetical protein